MDFSMNDMDIAFNLPTNPPTVTDLIWQAQIRIQGAAQITDGLVQDVLFQAYMILDTSQKHMFKD